jgi:uncharacterized protein involved in exopolysaccharide biosynthesis
MINMEKDSDVNRDVEISLLNLISILISKKKIIIIITAIGMFIGLVVSIISLLQVPDKSILPNVYTSKAHMLINDSSSSGGSLSSLLSSSGLGSLASLAGLNTSGGSKYSALAVYLTGSNEFLDAIVDKFGLIDQYKIKKNPRSESRKKVKQYLISDFDNGTGVFTISFTDKDPVFAQSVVNFAVATIEKRFTEMGLDKNKLSKENLEINLKNSYNEIVRLQQESQLMMSSVNSGRVLPSGSSVMLEANRMELELRAQESVYTQLKTQYELVKVELASETPVFQVLEYAEVPDQKSGPSRGKLCIIMTFASFFISIFIAFFLNAIENIRKNPNAMAKLKPISK